MIPSPVEQLFIFTGRRQSVPIFLQPFQALSSRVSDGSMRRRWLGTSSCPTRYWRPRPTAAYPIFTSCQCHPVSPRVSACHPVPPRVTACLRVSPRVTACLRVSPRVTPCHRVSPRVTPCHRVSPGSPYHPIRTLQSPLCATGGRVVNDRSCSSGRKRSQVTRHLPH